MRFYDRNGIGDRNQRPAGASVRKDENGGGVQLGQDPNDWESEFMQKFRRARDARIDFAKPIKVESNPKLVVVKDTGEFSRRVRGVH